MEDSSLNFDYCGAQSMDVYHAKQYVTNTQEKAGESR